jgi:acetoin utilization deacetylase AcuC-like enzyme
MPDHPSDHVWDEYDWERCLQEQEQRTEKYMELLEKYLNHPQRDEIIAREMGWTHLLNGESSDWEEEVDAQFEKEIAENGIEEESVFGFQRHPLYQATSALCAELDVLFSDRPTVLQEHPASVSLRSHVAFAAAKLAAALNDDDIAELGMSIAYLKRALHALTGALDAILRIEELRLLESEDSAKVRERLFHIRDGIVSTMGDYRAEFRRRFHR